MKPIPPWVTFREALIKGLIGRVEDRKYLGWVRTLPCVVCASLGADPHHLHGVGFKGMGTKVPDFWTIPLCRTHHDELHADRVRWEETHGSQWEHVALTMLQKMIDDKA